MDGALQQGDGPQRIGEPTQRIALPIVVLDLHTCTGPYCDLWFRFAHSLATLSTQAIRPLGVGLDGGRYFLEQAEAEI